jgi:hypothetical protein
MTTLQGTSSFLTSVDVGGAANPTFSSSKQKSPKRSRKKSPKTRKRLPLLEDLAPGVLEQFSFSETSTSPLPCGCNVTKLLGDTVIRFRSKGREEKELENADDFLKHVWRVSFMESPYTKAIVEDLFWWTFRKIHFASKTRPRLPGSNMLEEQNISTSPSSTRMYRFNSHFDSDDEEEVSALKLLEEGRERVEKEAAVDEHMMRRVSDNYVKLFQKLSSDIQTFVEDHDPFDKRWESFPADVSRFPMIQRQMHVRARMTCDPIIAAIPDALGQVLYDVFHRTAKKMIDRFEPTSLQASLADVCHVLIGGMRPTNAAVKHWLDEQSRVRMRAGIKTAVPNYAAVGSGRSPVKKLSGGPASSESKGFTFRRPSSPPSMPLKGLQQSTRCRLTLGNSRLVQAFLNRHEAATQARGLKLNITLTTRAERPELTKPIEANPFKVGGEEVFEWVVGEPLVHKMAKKDKWETDKGVKEKTVRDMVKEALTKQNEIQASHRLSQKQFRKSIRDSKRNLEQAYQILGNEQRRVSVGDMNEWANNFTERKLFNNNK